MFLSFEASAIARGRRKEARGSKKIAWQQRPSGPLGKVKMLPSVCLRDRADMENKLSETKLIPNRASMFNRLAGEGPVDGLHHRAIRKNG